MKIFAWLQSKSGSFLHTFLVAEESVKIVAGFGSKSGIFLHAFLVAGECVKIFAGLESKSGSFLHTFLVAEKCVKMFAGLESKSGGYLHILSSFSESFSEELTVIYAGTESSCAMVFAMGLVVLSAIVP